MPVNNDFGNDGASNVQPDKDKGGFAGFGDFMKDKIDDLGVGGAVSDGFGALQHSVERAFNQDEGSFSKLGDKVSDFAGDSVDKLRGAGHSINEKFRDGIPGFGQFEDGFGKMGDSAQNAVESGVRKLGGIDDAVNEQARKVPGFADMEDGFNTMGDAAQRKMRSDISDTMSNFGVSMPDNYVSGESKHETLGFQSKAAAQRDAIEHGRDPELAAGDQVDHGMDY